MALGAQADGTLDSMTHESVGITSRYEEFARKNATWGGALYKCANTKFAQNLARLDVTTPVDMRAPGASSGVYALECAIDELAVALKMDPVELRLRNYSDRDQNADAPYTSKALRECYRRWCRGFRLEPPDSRPALHA